MPWRWSRVLAWALGLPASLLALMLLTLWALAGSDWGRARLLAHAQEEVKAAAGASLEVASLTGNLFTNLEIGGLRLTREGRALLTIDQVELRYNPLALLGGRLRLGKLRLLRPRLNLPLDLAASGDGFGGLPLVLSIGRLEVVDGSLEAGGLLGPLERLSGLGLEGGFSLGRDGPAFQGRLLWAEVEFGGQPAPLVLGGRARLRGPRLEVSELQVKSGASHLVLEGVLDWGRGLEFNAQGRGELADLAALRGLGLPLGRLAAPLAMGLNLRGRPEGLGFQVRAEQGRGSLEAQGSLNMAGPDLKATVRVDGLDTAAWGLQTWPAVLSGGLEFSARGRPGQPGARASLSLNLEGLDTAGLKARGLSLEASLEGEQARVSKLRLESDHGGLEATASLTLPGPGRPLAGQAQADFQELTLPPGLAASLPEPWRQARLQGRAQAKGSLDDLALEVELGPSRLASQVEVSRLGLRGGRDKEGWRLGSLEMEADGARLQARGRAGLATADLEFSLESPELARLTPLLAALGLIGPPGLEGSLSAHGRLRGPWSGPALALELKAGDLALPQAYVKVLEFSLDSPRLGLPLSGGMRLEARGLEGGDITWSRIEAQGAAGPAGVRLDLAAQGPQLRLGLRLDGGQLSGPPWPLDLSRLNLGVRGAETWVQRGRARLDLAPHRLAVQGLRLTQDDQEISLEGEAGQAGALRAVLDLSRLHLAQWLPPKALPAQSRLDLRASLGGSMAAPTLGLEGRLHGLVWPHLPASEVRFQGSYQGHLLEAAGRAITQGRATLDLQASLGLRVSLRPPRLEFGEEGLQARVRADDLPLALLEPVIPGLQDIKGRLSLDIGAEGPVVHPQVRGSLVLEDGGFTISPTGQVLSDLKARLTARGRRVTLDELSADTGGGQEARQRRARLLERARQRLQDEWDTQGEELGLARAGQARPQDAEVASLNPGRAVLKGHLDLPLGDDGLVDLDFQGRGIKVGLGAIGEVITDAHLKFSGTALKPLATGWTRPTRAEIHPGMAVPASLGEVVMLRPGQTPPPLRRDEHKAPVIVLGGPLGPLALDARVELDPGLRIEVDEGQALLGGFATVRKEPGGPLTFHDRFNVLGGALIIRGRRFVLTGGTALFSDKNVPDPDMNVDVKLNMGSTLVYIALRGTAFSPQLQLSSEPPMSQADILSTIIFGRPSKALNAGETRQLSAQALALLGAGGRQEIQKIVGPTLSPDVVTVYSEAQGGSALEAGKYLSEDLYLRYRQNLGAEGGQNVGLEYRLNRYMSLESQIGTTRDSGVDMIFNFDFN